MAYTKTNLAVRADNLRERALHLIDAAREALQEAEVALLEEEGKHRAPSPANQAAACRYTDAANELERVWETITGEPRMTVISTKATGITRIFRGDVIEERQLDG